VSSVIQITSIVRRVNIHASVDEHKIDRGLRIDNLQVLS